jgi:cytochrome c
MQTGRDVAATGGLLFERNCQSCHGEHGEGTDKGPAVLGKKRIGKRFKNAQLLFEFIEKEMPKDNPGSLDVAQCWNLVTFMVAASGKKVEDRLSESNAEDTRLDK